MRDFDRDFAKVTPGRVRTNIGWSIEKHRLRIADRFDPERSRKRFQLWIKLLESEGIRFSEWIRSQYLSGVELESGVAALPRVVGLLVDRSARSDSGLVNPLIAEHLSDSDWSVHLSYLPFQVGQLQDCLFKLLSEIGLSGGGVLPELIAFSVSENLNERSEGQSMDIAGLLAIVDAMNGKTSPLFQCACAIVQPDGNRLSGVDSAELKLEAFRREFGHASLLVCGSQFVIPHHLKECFPEQNVWRVDSFAELAHQLVSSGQLQVFEKQQQIRNSSLRVIQGRLHWLQEQDRIGDALKFSERLEKVVLANKANGIRVRQEIEIQLQELSRHIGSFQESIKYATFSTQEISENPELFSYQEEVEANVRLAAALFDGHEFEKAESLLSRWVVKVNREMQLIDADSKVKLFNTLGRILIVLNRDGWQELFRRSIELQRLFDPENVVRTQCYLVQGLLRFDLGAAEKQLVNMEEEDAGSSADFLKFYRAELARRKGDLWEDLKFESDREKKGGHAFGFYLQATARQNGRSQEDAQARFSRAASVFSTAAGRGKNLNLLNLFAAFMNLGVAVSVGSHATVVAELERVQKLLSEDGAIELSNYYQEYLQSSIALEELLSSVPYF